MMRIEKAKIFKFYPFALLPISSASLSNPVSSLMLCPSNFSVGCIRPCFCYTTCHASCDRCFS